MRRAWFYVFAASCILCIYFVAGYRTQVNTRFGLDVELAEASRQLNIARKFRKPFESMQKKTGSIPNTRVRWVERLGNLLDVPALHSVTFRIQDPVLIRTDLAAVGEFRQYPLRIIATLDSDEDVLRLLQLLSRHSNELFENRACSLRRGVTQRKLKLECLYTIYDIVLPKGRIK